MAKIQDFNGRKYKVNILLQLLLHFNAYISAVWVVTFSYILSHENIEYGKLQGLLMTFGFLLTTPAESLRLYFGYMGNLCGRVSDLAAFWIITTLIQLPIQTYFTFNFPKTTIPYLEVSQSLLYLFIILEIPIAIYASRKLSIHQAALYQINLLYEKSRETNQ